MLKILYRIGIVLLAAGIISGGTALLVASGALSNRAVAGLVEGDTGRQFTRTLVNPPAQPAGGGFAREIFGQRDFGRDALLAAGLSDLIRNLVLIAAITVGVLVIRKLLAAVLQIIRRNTAHSPQE